MLATNAYYILSTLEVITNNKCHYQAIVHSYLLLLLLTDVTVTCVRDEQTERESDGGCGVS